MSSILPAGLLDVEREYSAQDIEKMLLWYSKQKNNASLEGLGSIAGNIGVAFGDFIFRIGNNIRTGVTGIFKDFKRSALQEVFDKNKFSMNRVMRADYTTLAKVVCAFYPFTTPPVEAANYFKDEFVFIGMEKRVIQLIDEYLHLSAAIHTGNTDTILSVLRQIGALNLKQQLTIKDRLPTMVAIVKDTNRTTFGNVFNAVSEYEQAVMMTLQSSKELDAAMKTGKILDTLYHAFDKLKSSIIDASKKDLDMSVLSGLTAHINDTGELIESYAMLTREYHHLEWWLSTTSVECMKVVK